GLDTVLDDIEIVDLDTRYTVERPLGEGGMGAVVLATDTRLGRKVAIKQIRNGSARSKSAIARFQIEAKAIAAISHPNVIQIYDFGVTKTGPFLVIEYIDGGSLLDRCKRGAIPLEEAVEIFVQICQGLGRSHDLGIVHRDIKPANILLTKDGIAKLTDFGLAKAEAADHGMTMAGAVMGTPDFMPPEQRQDAALVDHRSDLWSLAAAFYQAVSGRSPKVIRLHELPQALQPIMSKALEDEKDARYQSAKEFRDALKSILQAGSAKPAVFEGELQEGQCKACGTVNLDLSRKFCKKCVASLRMACLACDVQIPVWDKICGECGGNQPVLFESKHTQISGQKASAKALAADLAFDKAIGIAEEIAKETHPELAVFVSWSKSFIESTNAERDRQQALSAERLKDGQKHFAAFDYAAAIQAIEAIPESLRIGKASKLLTDCRSLQDESVRLVEKITIRIKRTELEGLLPLVSRAVELRGDRQDLLKIRQKLEERRDKKLSLAQAAMEAGDARTAAATLAGVVAEDLGAVGGDLLKRVQRAAALEVLLAEGIKSSKADSVVTNDEARGLLVLCDEYLLLNPQGVKVQAIREQLLKRQE
ncbi:MAG: serine/threonine-protein kinase, partial [Planctomycetia bacterium]|nr:serine/threonine-protein kinase [Planctomycetia bacterium]